jgi:hypothetical protein
MSSLRIRLDLACTFVRAAHEHLQWCRACDIEAMAHYGERGWRVAERTAEDGHVYHVATRRVVALS